MAIVEMSWTAAGPLPAGSPLIAGNQGTLTAYLSGGRREGQVVRGGTLELITPENPDGTLLDVPELPVGQRSAVDYFLGCLERDQPFEGMLSATVSRDAQEFSRQDSVQPRRDARSRSRLTIGDTRSRVSGQPFVAPIARFRVI